MIEPSEQNSEKWMSTEGSENKLIIQGEPHWIGVSCLDHPLETEIPHSEPGVEDHSSARDAKQARGESEQALSGEIPIPSADETLQPPEIPSVPFFSWGLFKRWCEAYTQ